MDALLLVLWSGLAAGSLHVVTGADHLAALLPLAVGGRGRAFWLGARWGLGHSGGVLVIGALGVLLREQIDVEAVGAVGERLVGLMLVGLGAFGVRRALRLRIHSHAHQHEGDGHRHIHVHRDQDGAEAPRRSVDPSLGHGRAPHSHAHTAFLAGTLHGVAGTAHILGVLPAVAMGDAAAGAAYLLAFALGTVAAMGAFSAVVGQGSVRFAGGAPRILKGLMYAAGVATILVGVVWIVFPLLGYELAS